MTVVVPMLTPVRLPAVVIEATAGVPLVNVPPPGVADKLIVAPMHTADAPVIGPGNGLILMVAVPVIVRLQSVVLFVATTV